MARVIVVGSLNVDLVVHSARLPSAGETVQGSDLVRHQGGKGGNQATAAARLGSRVAFVGAVGRDDFGASAREALEQEGIDTSQLAQVDRPTGVALIVVDERAENMIAVAPGANSTVDAVLVQRAFDDMAVTTDDVVLVCREVPPDAVRAALAGGRAAGALTILNPAPAEGLQPETRRLADVLTPNESELALLTQDTAGLEAAAEQLLGEGTRWLAVTLGPAGAHLFGSDGTALPVPAPRVTPVDTTGAGDCFNGALAAAFVERMPPAQAVERAVRAATLSTLRPGARGGMPTARQVADFAPRG